MVSVDSMPSAANAMPNMLAVVYAVNMVQASNIMGTVVDLFPSANPKIILTASPCSQPFDNSITGALFGPVIYSVYSPMANPETRPQTTDRNA